jgi:hypothetical protein
MMGVNANSRMGQLGNGLGGKTGGSFMTSEDSCAAESNSSSMQASITSSIRQ